MNKVMQWAQGCGYRADNPVEGAAATWAEIDLEAALWVIPAIRMKAGSEHKVPLSTRAVEVLEAARRLNPKSELVFPTPKGGLIGPYHVGRKLLARVGAVATVHGFRSSFRNWAGELSGASHDAMERALAHTIDNKAERAYNRTVYLDQRRKLMADWAAYLGDQGDQGCKVVKLAARR